MLVVKKNRNKHCFCLVLVLVLVLCASMTVFAKEQPDAGKIISGQQEHNVAFPEKANVMVKVAEEQTSRPQQSQGAKIKINSIHITGQNIYSEETLQNLVKDAWGNELTLSEMEGLADRIATYLHEQGYIVSGAYIPMQEIKDGILEIKVVIGQYGRIDLYNRSKLFDDVAIRMLNNIKVGDYVKNDVLERTLLLLNDVGDISSKGTLVPGKMQGTTDLIVELSDAVKKTGKVFIDNYGNRFTGQNRVNVALNINDLSGIGDSASIGGTTAGRGLNDVNLGYSLLVGSEGAKVGMGYYQMHYTLGKEFASLNAHGEAEIVNLYGAYPIVRSRNYNLYAHLGYEHKKLQDIHASQNVTVRDNWANVWNIGVSGDSRDRLGGGGINIFEMNLYSGNINTNDLTTSIPGSYAKTLLNYTRRQYINDRLNFLLGFTGQLANKNLDSTEKISLGGASGIKAYSQGEVYGDQGYLLTGELLWNVPTPTYQVAVYFERGSVTNKKNPVLGDVNSCTLSGAGLGLIYNNMKNYSLRLDYAWKINSPIAAFGNDKNGRFWLQGIRYF